MFKGFLPRKYHGGLIQRATSEQPDALLFSPNHGLDTSFPPPSGASRGNGNMLKILTRWLFNYRRSASRTSLGWSRSSSVWARGLFTEDGESKRLSTIDVHVRALTCLITCTVSPPVPLDLLPSQTLPTGWFSIA